MLRLHLAELRGSATAWLGVALTFVAVNTAFVISALIYNTGLAGLESGRLTFEQSAGYTAIQALMLIMIALVSLPVISSSTALVVAARRGSLARLALAGATPAQVRTTLVSQLVAVSLASAVLGDVLGIALVRPMLALIAVQQQSSDLYVAIEPVFGAVPVLLANLLCVGVALIGGAKHAGRASRIPPVEGLRAEAPTDARPGLRPGSWVLAIALGLVIVGCFASIPLQAANRSKETVSNLLTISFVMIFLCGALLFVLTPLLVDPLTRVWTGLIRSSSPAWVLARANTIARATRLRQSVTPVMFAVGVAVGSAGTGASMIASLSATLNVYDDTSPYIVTFVVVFGQPLVVAFAGSIGSLLMMSRQRDAELALVGIVGATPAQRVHQPLLESLIIVGTSLLLALGMIVPAYMFQALSLPSVGVTYVPVIPADAVAWSALACLIVTAAATVLPTLPARSIAEPRVIARLIAE